MTRSTCNRRGNGPGSAGRSADPRGGVELRPCRPMARLTPSVPVITRTILIGPGWGCALLSAQSPSKIFGVNRGGLDLN